MNNREIIRLEKDGRVFNHRVVGVVLDEGWTLLHKSVEEDFWTFPGGRVELLEPSAEALHREMLEELGVEVSVGRLLWVVENFFEYQEKKFHEVDFYFLMHLSPGSPFYSKHEPFRGNEEGLELIFQWHRIDILEAVRLFPSFLRVALQSPPESTMHVVHTDVDVS